MAREEAEIKELTKKLEQSPDSMVFVQLADAYRRSGNLEKCVEICVKGLERHPTYTTARTILGRAYLDLGTFDEAVAEFKKIEASDPENIVAQRMLGQIFMQKGLYAEAIVRHQKVLALDPDDTAAQELLQQALTLAKQTAEGGAAKSPAGSRPAPAVTNADAGGGTIKVAEIYIKKGAYDEAVEVLNEVLATDPGNALAAQKLKEIEARRNAGATDAKQKDEEEAKQKAADEAKRKAEEEAKHRAADEAKHKAEEEAKQKAADEAKRRAEEEAKHRAADEAKHRAEEEAKQKAADEAKRKAEEEAKQKAADEAKRKAEEEAKHKAADEAKHRAEEEGKQKAADAKRKAEEEARQNAAEEKKNKISTDDILSVMKSDDDEMIGEGSSKAAAVASHAGPDPGVKESIAAFLKNNAMEASLLIGSDGKLLDSAMPSGADAPALGAMASSIFINTEKAAQRMRFGNLTQVIVASEDGRQILFVSLKSGVLVAVTGKGTNLGQLRIAINDLKKKA